MSIKFNFRRHNYSKNDFVVFYNDPKNPVGLADNFKSDDIKNIKNNIIKLHKKKKTI